MCYPTMSQCIRIWVAILYTLGIERTAPKYHGLLLEDPTILPKGNSGDMFFWQL